MTDFANNKNKGSQMEPRWATARYADCGRFLEWVVSWYPGGMEQLTDDCKHSDRWARRLYAWKSREYKTINVDTTLDEFCLFIGVHLSSVPDLVFEEAATKKKKARKRLTKDEIKVMRETHKQKGVKAAARVVNVSEHTVRHYARAEMAA